MRKKVCSKYVRIVFPHRNDLRRSWNAEFPWWPCAVPASVRCSYAVGSCACPVHRISTMSTHWQHIAASIGVADRGRGHLVPPKQKNRENIFGQIWCKIWNILLIFLLKYHIKFGHFVHFWCIYFRTKMFPLKLTKLLRLWLPDRKHNNIIKVRSVYRLRKVKR